MSTRVPVVRYAPRSAARLLFFAAGAIVVASLVATLAWVISTVGSRPLDGVEGDVLFEADRLRAGYALYVDPAVGAREYGEPPARYLVLYPPLWSAALSVVPTDAAALVARIAATIAWLGALAFVALRAPRNNRAAAAALAVLTASIWVLALYGTSGRPDAAAVCAVCLGLDRASRRGKIDAAAGALFALAAWLKPNVIGAAPGAFVVAFAVGGLRAVAGGLVGAAASSVGIAGVLSWASGPRWVTHLVASTGQPPSAGLLASQLAARLPFFAGPMGFAIACGVRARRDPGAAIATGALVTSAVWSIACLAKIGSAANYFLEPMAVAVVVVARAGAPSVTTGGRAALALAVACVVQAAWTGVASVKSALAEIPRAHERARAVSEARAVCGARPREIVLADEPGLERMLNGRIVATPFQATHLARRGRYPTESWIVDVEREEVACLVMQDDLLERPVEAVDVVHDRFGPELRRALAARFALADVRGGYRIYRARDKENER